MARRRKQKGSRKKDKSIPLSSLLPAMPAIVRVANDGFSLKYTPTTVLYEMVGYAANEKTWVTSTVTRQIGLGIAGIVSHKLANKVGLNRALKKASMGYIQW